MSLKPKIKECLALSEDIMRAAYIEFYTGDREPGYPLSRSSRKLMAEALKHYAKHLGEIECTKNTI